MTNSALFETKLARSYIKSIHRKLDAHSRETVIRRGKELGLI